MRHQDPNKLGENDWRNCCFTEDKVVSIKKNGGYIAVCCRAKNNAGYCKHALCPPCLDDEKKLVGRRETPDEDRKIVCRHAVKNMDIEADPWWCQKDSSTGEWSHPFQRQFAPLGCVKCMRMFVE